MKQNNSNIIKSILTGLLVCIVLGYDYSNTSYYYNGHEVKYENDNTISSEKFNYKVGLTSGAIVTLFLMLFYDNKNRINLSGSAKKISNIIDNSKKLKKKFIDINYFKRFFNTNGRMGRTEYVFKLILLKLFCYGIFRLFGNEIEGVTQRIIFIAILGIFYFFILSVLITKRLHDIGLSSWSIVIGSILIGISYPLFELETFFNVVGVIYVLIFIIVLTFYPGSKSENKYGVKRN